jgi:hypothetical protein
MNSDKKMRKEMICHSKLKGKELQMLYDIVMEFGDDRKDELRRRLTQLITRIRWRDWANMKGRIKSLFNNLP